MGHGASKAWQESIIRHAISYFPCRTVKAVWTGSFSFDAGNFFAIAKTVRNHSLGSLAIDDR